MITALLLATHLVLAQEVRTFEIINPEVHPGDTVVVRMEPQWRVPLSCIAAFGKRHSPNEFGYVFIGINLSTKLGKEEIFRVDCGLGFRLDSYSAEVTVTAKEFPKTRNIRRGQPSEPCGGSRLKQVRETYNALAIYLPDLTSAQTYRDPMDIARDISHYYGFIYASNPSFPHCGVDLRMKSGTRVRAINRGIVALTGRFRTEGNIIIVNHGLGIFSVYMHLSRINVKVGQIIENGQVIGFSGRTGAGVTEDHLHLNIWIHDGYVDPLLFVDTVNQHLK